MTLCLGKSFVDQGLSKSTCVSIYNIECLINQVEFSKSFLYCQHMISWRQSWIENGHDPGAETGTLPSSSTDPKGWNVQGQLPATDEASRIPELVSIVPISEKKIHENISTFKLQIHFAILMEYVPSDSARLYKTSVMLKCMNVTERSRSGC